MLKISKLLKYYIIWVQSLLKKYLQTSAPSLFLLQSTPASQYLTENILLQIAEAVSYTHLYYDKYTSPLYRAGYFISYLIQNILFDYTYMKRNFNFCKGLDVYDGGAFSYTHL